MRLHFHSPHLLRRIPFFAPFQSWLLLFSFKVDSQNENHKFKLNSAVKFSAVSDQGRLTFFLFLLLPTWTRKCAQSISSQLAVAILLLLLLCVFVKADSDLKWCVWFCTASFLIAFAHNFLSYLVFLSILVCVSLLALLFKHSIIHFARSLAVGCWLLLLCFQGAAALCVPLKWSEVSPVFFAAAQKREREKVAVCQSVNSNLCPIRFQLKKSECAGWLAGPTCFL